MATCIALGVSAIPSLTETVSGITRPLRHDYYVGTNQLDFSALSCWQSEG